VHIDRANQARAAGEAEAEQKSYRVAKAKEPPKLDARPGDWNGVPALRIARPGSGERAQARTAYDTRMLYVLFEVRDPSPWKNAGRDFARLFKTGDAVDVQLSPSGNTRRDPVRGDVRILIAPVGDRPVAVLMRPVEPGAPDAAAKSYTSPILTHQFDRVQVLEQAELAARVAGDRYAVEAAIPLQALGIEPEPGARLTGDLGFISSDAAGSINVARTYWANRHTNLVNDEPSESWLYPRRWGELSLE
jgi:hypothetical protein